MGITPAFMTRYIPASIPTVATLRPEGMIKHMSSHLVVSAGVTDHSQLIPLTDNHHAAIEVALTNEVEVLDEHQLELSKEVVKQLEHDELRIQQAMDVAMSNIDHELENGVDDMEDETSTVHMMITTESTPATMSEVDSSNNDDVTSSEQNTVDLFKCTHCDKSFKTSAQLTSEYV
ncbi:unnamed protein product, partial [Timema podura]|nr:unnamed protein product [Timema podura]